MQKFSAEWKATCLRVLLRYKEAKKAELSVKRIGWTRIRDEVVAEYEAVEGRLSNINGSILRRQDLEKWEKFGSISDSNFSVVDQFIRSLLVSKYKFLSSEVVEMLNAEKLQSLRSIYTPRHHKGKETHKILGGSARHFSSFAIVNAWYKYIFIKVTSVIDDGIICILGYSKKSLESISKEEYKDIILFDGFLIPQRVILSVGAPKVSDLPIERRGTNDSACIGVFSNPTFRGHIHKGHSHCDTFIQKFNYDDSVLIEIDYPPPTIAPALYEHDIGRKYYSTNIVMEVNELKRDQKLPSPDSFPPGDLRGTFRWKASLHNKLSELEVKKIDEIIEQEYNGYIY